MNCTKKYKKCSCKWCKNITKRRAKPCEKAVWDKFNNGIKRLFEEPPPPLPPPPPPHLGNFKANRFEFYMGKILASIRYEEQKITDLKEYIDIFQGGHYTFCGTTIAKLVGKVIKRRLPPGDVTKKKVLKVMRSDPELKNLSIRKALTRSTTRLQVSPLLILTMIFLISLPTWRR